MISWSGHKYRIFRPENGLLFNDLFSGSGFAFPDPRTLLLYGQTLSYSGLEHKVRQVRGDLSSQSSFRLHLKLVMHDLLVVRKGLEYEDLLACTWHNINSGSQLFM
jgi:hypothetical protein